MDRVTSLNLGCNYYGTVINLLAYADDMVVLAVLHHHGVHCKLCWWLQFVEHFRYLSHIIDNCLCDDKDIQREVKALFIRANILCRRFNRCSIK